MISIIIPTHGRAKRLSELLASIEAQLDPPLHEVLVVSNLRDPKAELIAKSFGYRHLEAGALGANRARNLGIENSRGDFLLFLDDDCRLQNPSFLRLLRRAHDENPGLAGIGGPYLLAAGANAWDRAYHRNQMRWLECGERFSTETENLLGGNCSFKRSVLEQNRFNPEIVFGGTETELLARLARAGHRTRLFKELAIEHAARLGASDFLRKAFLQGAGAAHFQNWKIGARRGSPSLLFDIPFHAGFNLAASGKELPSSAPAIALYSLREASGRALRASRLKLAKDFLTPLRASAKIREVRPSPRINEEK